MRTADVIDGMCRWLSAQGFGVYRTDTPYVEGEKAIVVRRFPIDPDTALSVAIYDQTDSLQTPDRTVNVQLRFRTGKDARLTDVDDWADDVFQALNMKHGFDMGGIHVQRAVRKITAPLGADENGREERADSYELLLLV